MAKVRVQLGTPRFELVTTKLIQDARPECVFDFSMLDEFLNCHRSYLYRYEWHLTRVGGAAHSLVFGDGTHEALKAHYTLLRDKKIVGRPFDKEEHLEAMERAFLKATHKAVLANEFPLFIEDQPDGKRYLLNAWKIFNGYLDCYPIENFEVLDIEVPIAYIIPFDLDGEVGEIIYIGRVDLLIQYLGHLHIMEHKTSSIMGKNFMASFRPNHQVSGYIGGMRERTGLPIYWGLINAIGVYKNDPKFERERVRRETDEIISFENQVINMTREILWYRERIQRSIGTGPNEEEAEDIFYQNPRYCFKWNTACQFHILCQKASKTARHTLMAHAYAKSVWSPFKFHNMRAEDVAGSNVAKNTAEIGVQVDERVKKSG